MKTLLAWIAGLFSADQVAASTPAPGTGHTTQGQAVDESPDPSGPAAPVQQVARELRVYLASKSRTRLSPDQVSGQANMWDVGYVDSLSYVEFLAFIEKQYNVTIPDVQLTARLSTVDAVARFICSEAKSE
jgi:acyl carrier protein